MKFDSTSLPQTGNPQEIQKGNLDLLDKVNKTARFASDEAAAAAAASVPLNNPVPGEPSLGTWHDIASPTTGYAYDATPADTNWHTVVIGTATGQVPTDTKKVLVAIILTGTNNGNAGEMYYRPTGSGLGQVAPMLIASIPGAAVGVLNKQANQVAVPIDASGQVDISTTNVQCRMQISYPASYMI